MIYFRLFLRNKTNLGKQTESFDLLNNHLAFIHFLNVKPRVSKIKLSHDHYSGQLFGVTVVKKLLDLRKPYPNIQERIMPHENVYAQNHK